MLVDIRPIQTPETNTHEFFVGADHPIAKYREKLKEWEARGWRIDVDTVRRNSKRVAYAIPSPARREAKGWILDPVPMMPAQAQARLQEAPASAEG